MWSIRSNSNRGNKELVAYYVPTDNSQVIDVNALRSGLKTVLPPYMIPAYFEELEALPLLPSHKVDRSKLPAAIWHTGT